MHPSPLILRLLGTRRMLFAMVAMAMGLLGAAPHAHAEGLFGMVEIRSNRVESIPKWVNVLERTRQEDMLGRCESDLCKGARKRWFDMVQDEREEDRYAQMVVVNRWLNNHRYITDYDLWGKSDFWETPGQFVDKSGDCEDYAIAKYYTLRMLGWPEDDLRLVVLYDSMRQMPHAVLAVRYNGENYLLDNLSTQPIPDKFVHQYTPYYAINAQHRWVFIKPVD
jgi:predicted transglutaminase-like cysteine proteinase